MSRWMWESGDQVWWECPRAAGRQVKNDRWGKFLRKWKAGVAGGWDRVVD